MHRLGIRAEDKKGERRCPLTPRDLSRLTSRCPNLQILVERDRERAFSEAEFAGIDGVEVRESLSDCPTLLGIKEVETGRIEAGKTYAIFSHTYKGQSANMEMLRRFRRKGCTLVDYELLVQDVPEVKYRETFELRRQQVLATSHGRVDILRRLPPAAFQSRTAHFCRYAGIVGALESLASLGRRYLKEA